MPATWTPATKNTAAWTAPQKTNIKTPGQVMGLLLALTYASVLTGNPWTHDVKH